MSNCYTCNKNTEIIRLRSRITALENGSEIKELKETVEQLKKQLSSHSPQRPSDRLSNPVSTTALLAKIDKMQDLLTSKNLIIEELEGKIREMEKQAKKDHRASRDKINDLERKLNAEERRHEKALEDMAEKHNKKCAEIKRSYEHQLDAQKKEFEEQLLKKDATIKDLKALQEQQKVIPSAPFQTPPQGNTSRTNSRNSSTPPRQDPDHPTIVSNNRTSSGKPVGGQIGHEHHPRKWLKPNEIIEIHPPKEVMEHPDDYYPTGNIIKKQRISMKLVVYVTEYDAIQYRNRKTKRLIHGDFPDDLGPLEVNYDPSVEATMAWLHSVGNMSYNKISEYLRDHTDGILTPSEGTMANLERRFARETVEQREKLAEQMLKDPVMNIDGTYLRVNGKLQNVLILRTESGVFYKATGCKGQKAVDQTFAGLFHGTTVCDGETTFHKIGDDYQTCLIHKSRYLKGAMENEPELTFPGKMHDFLWRIVMLRDIQKGQGFTRMPEDELEKIRKEYMALIEIGRQEYEDHPPRDDYRKGFNTYKDMAENMDHHLLFLTDYRIPYHNNDAEKSARQCKVHSSINGGMRSFEALEYHAETMTVLETANMKDENRFNVLKQVFEHAKSADNRSSEQLVEEQYAPA